ncbi:MAG: hypothetical protein DWQ18_04655 [Crenarchaeota archaeon]|nr:MAG: hypothetical protein DWQ17_08475 [Thermoproteota archaeon]RDJ34190.1 MAG: hypothetical protein DWQ18_04655 [Thermoproteota archaeon]RDJ36695.1 MAG: hypothetical protein DWQ13_05955 [Thermoproteota archaeon]RDJ37772.1 MAG: hypothetical protein DWQ19_04880 [Thermoproteota archaeon]
METDVRIIDIDKCPLCQKKHSHELSIEGGHVMYSLSGPVNEKDFDKQFTIFLTCPNKDQTFKTSITLNTFGYHIIKVEEKK